MRVNRNFLFLIALCTLLLPFLSSGFPGIQTMPPVITAALPAPTVTPQILYFSQFADNSPGGEVYNTWQAINDTHGTDYIRTNLTSYTNLAIELPYHHILLIPEQELIYSENITAIAAAWQTPLNDFLSQGGIIIVMTFYSVNFGPIASANILNETGLMDIQGSTPATGSPVIIVDPTDPLADGVGGFTAPDGSAGLITTETGIVANVSSLPIVLHKQISMGHLVLMGMDFYNRDPEADLILRNAIRLFQPPSAPVLTDPGATISGFQVPLTWTAATDTDGIIDHYEVQTSADAGFSIIGQSGTTTGLSYNFTFLSNDTYYFRVRAIDNNTLAGPWSNIVSTYIEIPPITLPDIPGFPIEAIALGLVLSLGVIFVVRRRKQQKVSS
ncbi:MAG: Loki-CTERM sorting domain-containing protein [Candidatus Thorarchaeota archaeon]